MTLEDSSTYQLILKRSEARGEARGKVTAAHRMVFIIAGKRFGPAPGATEAALQGITDQDRLDRMTDRLLDATGWDDLLSTL